MIMPAPSRSAGFLNPHVRRADPCRASARAGAFQPGALNWSGADGSAGDTGCNLPPDPFACQIQQGNERKNKEEHNRW